MKYFPYTCDTIHTSTSTAKPPKHKPHITSLAYLRLPLFYYLWFTVVIFRTLYFPCSAIRGDMMDCMSLHIMRYYFSSRFVSSHLYLFYYELFIEWCNLSCNNNFLQASSLHRYGLYMAWILRVFHLYVIEIWLAKLWFVYLNILFPSY